MDFMIKFIENMEIQIDGFILHKFLII